MISVSWLSMMPHMLLAGGGVVVYLCGAFRPGARGLVFYLSLGVLIMAMGAVAWLPAGGEGGAGLLDGGPFSRYYTLLLLAVTTAVLLFLERYARLRRLSGEVLYGTLLLACLGMIALAGTGHWLVFFLGLELLSLCLYVLIAIRGHRPPGYEAGIKYFVMGAVASAFFVFGVGLLYGATGTLAIGAGLAALVRQEDLFLALPAVILILAGVGFKISLAPFHLWTPDVYEGAPAPITAFLATGAKLALIGALVRFFAALPDLPHALVVILWLLAAATMLIGNLAALVQDRVKRMLAYSSMAHMGYLLMALLAGGEQGLRAVLFYSAVYALMDLGAFGSIAMMSAGEDDLNHRQDFTGLGYRHPVGGALLAVSLLTLAGLPPTAGFFGKFMLFTAVFEAGFVWLAAIGLLSALISIYYYQKVVVSLYLRDRPVGRAEPAVGWAGSVACAIIVVLILWFGMMPQVLLGAVEQALSFH